MVGSGLVFRVEARFPNETWRKVCVRKSAYFNYIATYPTYSDYKKYHSYSDFNYTLCVSADIVPNDTNANDVIVGELRPESVFRKHKGIQLLRVQNATNCSEVAGLVNLNVYCLGYGE